MDIKKVIEKLIENTKLKLLQWEYLDSNYDLLRLSQQNISCIDNGSLVFKNSFYVKINDGYFVFANILDYYYLLVFPTLNSRDVEIVNFVNLDYPSYQDELLRLLNVIKKQYPQVDDVISDFLNNNF